MTDIFDAKLLPCPFCGASAEWEYTPWDNDRESGDDGSGWVECTGCHVQMPCGCRDEADERWNKRSSIENKQPEKKSTNLDSLRRDAQRYHFLREMDRLEAFVAIEQLDYSSNDEFDASVDTAMAKQTPKGK